MYDSLIEKMKHDAKELELKIVSKFKVINPTFEYQKNIEWQNLQTDFAEKSLAAIKSNIEEVQKNLAEVEAAIAEQNTRIEERIKQILERLKELKEDITDFEKPAYFG